MSSAIKPVFELSAGEWLNDAALVAAWPPALAEALRVRPRLPLELTPWWTLLEKAAAEPSLPEAIKQLWSAFGIQGAAVERVSHAYRDALSTPNCGYSEAAACHVMKRARPATMANIAGMAIGFGLIWHALHDPKADITAADYDIGAVKLTIDATFSLLCRLAMR